MMSAGISRAIILVKTESLIPVILSHMKRYELRKWHEGDDLMSHLLRHRGHEGEAFLSPTYDEGMHDPFLMKDMEKAVDRFLKAVEKKERIVVYSDFDADGIPGGALFHDFLKKIGYDNFVNYIPHRNDEGYGFHLEAIEQFAKDGTDLIITIDVGIVANEGVKKASELGMDVIVTDHHEPNGELPPAVAVLDPKRVDCQYPFKELCGTGVAYKFIQAILEKKDFGLKKGMEKWWLDLVGIATLSDMVPLVGENRVLAHFGLLVLRKSRRPAIAHMCKKLGINQRNMTEDDIGFLITPRINAASRMGHPDDAFKLLVAEDEIDAGRQFEHLSKINDERKGLVSSIVRKVHTKMKKREEMKSVIVAGDPDWKPSVLGLVANKLAEEYNRPVFLWGRENGNVLKGSCRSDGSVSLIELMNKVSSSFSHYGGHKMAAGFAVSQDGVHTLEEDLSRGCDELLSADVEPEPVWIDAPLAVQDVGNTIVGVLQKMSPFGVGNEKPLFMFQDVVPTEVKLFGAGKNHLEISFGSLRAIGFFMTPDSFEKEPVKGQTCTLIGHIEESFFRGRREIRVRIVDVL